MHIGLKIKQLRDLKLWTQAQLAEIAGVSERTVRRVESSGTAESATLLSILNALGTTIEELNKMYHDDDTLKDESKEKLSELKFLHRIVSGRELVRIIASAHQYGYDHHDCKTEDQIESVQGFLTVVADVLDIWDMIEIGQRFELENSLTTQIKELEDLGLWVFGDRQVDSSNNWVTAIIEVYSKDNPLIQKIKLEKDLVHKKK
jgi:transcriptional regulator with XRE-family HTH domain